MLSIPPAKSWLWSGGKKKYNNYHHHLIGRDLESSLRDLSLQVARIFSVDRASDGRAGSEDFLDGTREGLGAGAGSHLPGNIDNLVEGDVSIVLDVLGLLPVPGGLLQSADDQGGSRRNNIDDGITILDGELDRDLQSLPVLGGLGDIVSNLLWGKTERSNLRGKGRSSSDFTSDCSDVNDFNLVLNFGILEN